MGTGSLLRWQCSVTGLRGLHTFVKLAKIPFLNILKNLNVHKKRKDLLGALLIKCEIPVTTILSGTCIITPVLGTPSWNSCSRSAFAGATFNFSGTLIRWLIPSVYSISYWIRLISAISAAVGEGKAAPLTLQKGNTKIRVTECADVNSSMQWCQKTTPYSTKCKRKLLTYKRKENESKKTPSSA